MTRTVWFPPLETSEASTKAIVDWCTEQGIVPDRAARAGFRIVGANDGTLTAQYDEIRTNEGGAFYTSAFADGAFAKSPTERTVTSVPPVHPITGAVEATND